MGEDGFTDLNFPYILFGDVAGDVAGVDGLPIGEGDSSLYRIDVGDDVSFVLFKIL